MIKEERGGIKTVEDYISAPLDFSELSEGKEEYIKKKTTVRYEGPNVNYMVMLVDILRRPVYDVSIVAHHPDALLPHKKAYSISRLLPGKPEVIKFKFRPARVCGSVAISSEVSYVNPKTDHIRTEEIPPVEALIEAPIIYPRQIDHVEWMETVKALVNLRERILLPVPAPQVMDAITRVLTEVNMYPLEPSMAESPMGLKAKLRFYCESISEKYATLVDLLGESGRTKMLIRSFAENKALLIGFHHAVLDELDRELAIKQFILDPIIKKHIDIFRRPPPKALLIPPQSQPSEASRPQAPPSIPQSPMTRAPRQAKPHVAFSTPPKEKKEEVEKFVVPCFKCGKKMLVAAKERPVIIECPYCGAKGILE